MSLGVVPTASPPFENYLTIVFDTTPLCLDLNYRVSVPSFTSLTIDLSRISLAIGLLGFR